MDYTGCHQMNVCFDLQKNVSEKCQPSPSGLLVARSTGFVSSMFLADGQGQMFIASRTRRGSVAVVVSAAAAAAAAEPPASSRAMVAAGKNGAADDDNDDDEDGEDDDGKAAAAANANQAEAAVALLIGGAVRRLPLTSPQG
jgi:hypothetical protein